MTIYPPALALNSSQHLHYLHYSFHSVPCVYQGSTSPNVFTARIGSVFKALSVVITVVADIQIDDVLITDEQVYFVFLFILQYID